MKRQRILIITIATAIALTGLLYVLLVPYWQISNYSAARQRWCQSQPRHYTYEVIWQDALSTQIHWQIEMQNGQVDQIRDLTTSQSPNPKLLSYAERYIVIDNLFLRIKESYPPPSSIGGYIGRAYPGPIRFLAAHGWSIPVDWICTRPLLKVRYHNQWGYPTYIKYETNPCIATLASSTKIEVTINRFQALP